jgi:cyclopropane fatty-acyl-phospholipid synthase-like methyltransferase
MSYDYFTQAYRTGTDTWSHTPHHRAVSRLLSKHIPKDSLILDIGSGRGLLDLYLVKNGYKIIGIENQENLVKACNDEVSRSNLTSKARFKYAEALDIPFVDNGFHNVLEVGLLQHLPKSDWQKYITEVDRILANNGYFLNVSLSRETTMLLGNHPKRDDLSSFEKYGLVHHFFTEDDIKDLLPEHFTIVDQHVDFYDSKTDPGEDLALLFTLAQKNI